MKINFSKYNGAGNDFVIIDNRNENISYNSSLIKNICDRNFGIGGDGLILIKNSISSDFEIVHYTPDGNLGSLCGNGSRCAISFAFKNNIINKKTVFEAFDGVHIKLK
jgi:diaminopimelate epimerase